MPSAATAAADFRMGRTTSPSLDELKSFAQLICSNAGARIGPNRINRLAVDFARKAPNGSGWMFFLYFTNEVIRVSDKQRERLLLNPDIARVVSYADPTGERAVNNVDRRKSAPSGGDYPRNDAVPGLKWRKPGVSFAASPVPDPDRSCGSPTACGRTQMLFPNNAERTPSATVLVHPSTGMVPV